MKKNMLLAIFIATFFSCTEVLDEITISETGKEILIDSLNNLTEKDTVQLNDSINVEDTTEFVEEEEEFSGLRHGFFTRNEISDWKQKALENDPGWLRIQKLVEKYVSNPEADRWENYYKGSSCLPKDISSPYEPDGKLTGLMITAFSSIITGENVELCKRELKRYVDNPYLDFSNRNRYCTNSEYVSDVNPGFDYAAAVVKLFNTYTYLNFNDEKHDEFFIKAGEYFELVLNRSFEGVFSNRENGVISNLSVYGATGSSTTHDNGYSTEKLGRYYNNRRGDYARLLALLGNHYDNQSFKNSSRLFFQEWLKYSIYPDGTMNEMHRAESSNEEKGWQYCAITVNQMIEIADAFARHGDLSLYQYATSEGINKTIGGNKSLLTVIHGLLNYYDGTWKRYKYGKLIDTYVQDENKWYTFYIWFCQANIYYNDSRIKEAYSKSLPSGLKYVGAYAPWGGNLYTCPDKLFIYGDMEDKLSIHSFSK